MVESMRSRQNYLKATQIVDSHQKWKGKKQKGQRKNEKEKEKEKKRRERDRGSTLIKVECHCFGPGSRKGTLFHFQNAFEEIKKDVIWLGAPKVCLFICDNVESLTN